MKGVINMIKMKDSDLLQELNIYYTLGYEMNESMSALLYSLLHDDRTIVIRKTYYDKVTLLNNYSREYELSKIVSYDASTISCKLICIHENQIIYTIEFDLTRRPHEKDSAETDKESK